MFFFFFLTFSVDRSTLPEAKKAPKITKKFFVVACFTLQFKGDSYKYKKLLFFSTTNIENRFCSLFLRWVFSGSGMDGESESRKKFVATISSGNQLHCKKKCAKSKSTLSVLFVSLYPYCIVSDCHTWTKTENPPTHHASFFQFILKIQMRVVHTVFFLWGLCFPPKKKKKGQREREIMLLRK